MAGSRVFLLAVVAALLSACQSSLPVPDYVAIKPPAPYRTGADGLKIDNEDQKMDPEGYRIAKSGQRVGEVDVDAKMGNAPSNAMAGFYVSSIGGYAPGNVMRPSEGAASGAGYGPGSAGATMPSASEPTTATPMSPTTPSTTPTTPPAGAAPTPLTR